MPIKNTKTKNAMKINHEIIIYAIIAPEKTRIFVVRDFGFIFSCRISKMLVNTETSAKPMVPDNTELMELKIESIRNATGIETTSAIIKIRIILFAILLRKFADVQHISVHV